MSVSILPNLPGRFRRQMWSACLLRGALGAALLLGLVALYQVDPATRRWILAGMFAVAGLWLALSLRGLGAVKRARRGAALVAAGRLDEACEVLAGALSRLTPLRSAKILACHQLAIAAHLTRRYRDAVAISRELLAHRLGAASGVATATRLILADSLLGLDDVRAAAPVVQALDRQDLSLAEQMVFLPVALRCQLTAGRHDEAVQALAEKVRVAELMDSPVASLVHALLAEACRRTGLPRQQDYLLRRAALLADVEPIVARHRGILGSLPIESLSPTTLQPRNP